MQPMDATDKDPGMLYWAAEACRELRLKAQRHTVHIAAELDTNQSTVTRFETHQSQPRSVDGMCAAYARDLGMDVRQIWAYGLMLSVERFPPGPQLRQFLGEMGHRFLS